METQRDDRPPMSFQYAPQLAVRDVPKLYGIVETPDGEHAPIWLKADTRNREKMLLKQTRDCTVEYVPQDYRPIRARTGQNIPRRVKDYADDLLPRSAERAKQFAVSRVPKIYSAIIGAAAEDFLDVTLRWSKPDSNRRSQWKRLQGSNSSRP